MANEKFVRNDAALLDNVYLNLMKISAEIGDQEKVNPKLVEAFDSLLTTYFDVQEDGF